MSIWKQILLILILVALGAVANERYQRLIAPKPVNGASGGPSEVTVEVADAEYRTLQRTVEAVGTTRARQSVEIVPLAAGRVLEIRFSPGQMVQAGDVLVRLDDDIERANLTEAEALLVEQAQAVERAQRLQRTNAVALATLERVIAAKTAAEAAVDRARRRLADRVIQAPFAGIAGLTDVDLGARVDDETMITTLDDISEVEIQFALPEALFAEINIGQPVRSRSAAFPGRIFTGQVAHIDSRIDPVSRSFRTRALLPNPERLLPSGMFMSLDLTLAETESLVVPEEAIVVQAAETFVFVAENGRAARREVETGQRQEGYVAIKFGVGAGERVITRGLQRVRDGSPVKVLGEPATTESSVRKEDGS